MLLLWVLGVHKSSICTSKLANPRDFSLHSNPKKHQNLIPRAQTEPCPWRCQLFQHPREQPCPGVEFCLLMLLLSGKRSFTRKPCLSKNWDFSLFFFLFPPFAHFFAFVASPRKGKKIKGEKKKKIRLPAGRKSYSRNYFLLVSLCLGFHNPGELRVPLVIRAPRSHALRLEKHRQSFPAGKNTPGVGEDGWGAKILRDGLGEGCRLEARASCPCSVGRSCWSYRGAGGQDWDLESLEPCGQHLSAP